MYHPWRSRRRDCFQRGMVTVQFVLLLVPLCGVAAFVIDGGMMLENRRRVQATADAAALAAAIDLYQNYLTKNGLDPAGTGAASAFAYARAGGFNNDGESSSVTVHIPPTSGPFSGSAGYAEVSVQYNQPRGFSGVLGSGALPIRARSVARGRWAAFPDGILVLDPAGRGALSVSGNGSVIVKNTDSPGNPNYDQAAAVVVNSNDSQAALASGNASLTAPQFSITGSPGTNTTGNSKFNGTIESGVMPTIDPLLSLPTPDPGSLPVRSSSKLTVSSNTTRTLSPGVYIGGISVSGNAKVTLNPGIYYLQGGGFSTSGNAAVDGSSGVVLYNAPNSVSDVINISGNGQITLSPPASGIYQGLILFQDRNSTAPVSITGNGNLKLTGTFYAAQALLNVTGNGGTNNLGSQYISYDLKISGNGNVSVNWNSSSVARTRTVGLVE